MSTMDLDIMRAERDMEQARARELAEQVSKLTAERDEARQRGELRFATTKRAVKRMNELRAERDAALTERDRLYADYSNPAAVLATAHKERDEARAELGNAESKRAALAEAAQLGYAERDKARAEAKEWERQYGMELARRLDSDSKAAWESKLRLEATAERDAARAECERLRAVEAGKLRPDAVGMIAARDQALHGALAERDATLLRAEKAESLGVEIDRLGRELCVGAHNEGAPGLTIVKNVLADQARDRDWARQRAEKAECERDELRTQDLTSFEHSVLLSLRERIMADELGDRLYVRILDKILARPCSTQALASGSPLGAPWKDVP